MSVPNYDLNNVQFSSEANSFKNDSIVYTGTLTLPTSVPAGSTGIAFANFTLSAVPQFSQLYAFFQELTDGIQQDTVGSGYNTAQWYDGSLNNKLAVRVTAPVGSTGVFGGLVYPIINGTQVQVQAIYSNSASSTVTLAPLTIPFAFIEYTLTN